MGLAYIDYELFKRRGPQLFGGDRAFYQSSRDRRHHSELLWKWEQDKQQFFLWRADSEQFSYA